MHDGEVRKRSDTDNIKPVQEKTSKNIAGLDERNSHI
jgi:hypothetical protein